MGEYYKDGYDRLASAIAASGIQDYFKAGKRAAQYIYLYLNSSHARKKADAMKEFDKEFSIMKECKSFLCSEYFRSLSDLNGEVLYERLNRRIGEYANERFFKSSQIPSAKN